MKTHFKRIMLVVLLLISTTSYSQVIPSQQEEKPYIEVLGTAETDVIPDEIYVSITIRERFVNKVKISIEEQEEKLKIAIKGLGVDLYSLSLSDANADYVRVRYMKKDLLTKKEYTIKLTNATSVGQLFLELDKLEITDAFISKVDHSKKDSLQKDVNIKAIKVAKAKADYLLNAIGEQTGKPLLIRETEITPARNTNQEYLNVRGSRSNISEYYVDGVKVDSIEKNEIQFRKIKFRTSIYIKFAIK
jgi:uncharacterized protein YggE